ncbi:LytR/AlgR family response regulator transcription factor [Chryseolinea lacunae]|uniref:Response regulator transcription factor n=1 Tax=Chryseolinea lacunae TaxID=2801331 RepID=A0ABS1KUL3_9BACT|nr:LytTR family DNA-binding domain-containing protein [Chryseolinea lacunae]MBL0743146.1 response regulator transcription factor [Chryseolinea lacunae]
MIRCLVVDDEPLARQLLESYVKQVNGLSLVQSCENAIEAFTLLQKTTVDLILLDIQLPQVTGIDLLKSLKDRPRVILTTAYRQYAFDAYDLDVVDYLLKPISFDRFLRGISKIFELKNTAAEPTPTEAPAPKPFEEAYLYLKEDREMVKVYLNDILYIESLRDYVRVKTTQRQVVTYQKISYLEKTLPEGKFVRIHRSFIVPVDKILSFTPSSVKVGTHEIPIGRNYKNEALRTLNKNNLLSPARV